MVLVFKINFVDIIGVGDVFIGVILFKLFFYIFINVMMFENLVEIVEFVQKVSVYVCEKFGVMIVLLIEYEVSS